MGIGGQLQAPAALSPGKRPDAHCTGGWLGLRACLGGWENSLPSGFDPWTVQPAANRYSD
jgi:hypothetical protein